MISAWFLSDLHLKSMNERSSQRLLRFLLSLSSGERRATHLYLVGDIFDVWIGDHLYYENKFRPLIDAILKCQKKGIAVTYFEGNHDVHIKRYWESRYQIPCFVEAKYEVLGSQKVRIEHGDLINEKDETYLKYRDLIRTPFMQRLAHAIPGRVFHAIGEYASKESRKKSSVQRRQSESELRQMIRDYAERVYAEDAFDLIITGHMHIRDDWTFVREGRTVRSVNLGSWFSESLVFCLHEKNSSWSGEWVNVEETV